jgi:hypothetical protein
VSVEFRPNADGYAAGAAEPGSASGTYENGDRSRGVGRFFARYR